MSEYQHYEFRAIDRPLSHSELTELRAISTRAHITPMSFLRTPTSGATSKAGTLGHGKLLPKATAVQTLARNLKLRQELAAAAAGVSQEARTLRSCKLRRGAG